MASDRKSVSVILYSEYRMFHFVIFGKNVFFLVCSQNVIATKIANFVLIVMRSQERKKKSVSKLLCLLVCMKMSLENVNAFPFAGGDFS